MTTEETFDGDSGTDPSSDEGSDPGHLEDVDDGAGCAEIWEHLSEQRDDESDEE